MNNVHFNVNFKTTYEERNQKIFWDLKKKCCKLMQRRSTFTNTIIYFDSIHPVEHKLEAYRFINYV